MDETAFGVYITRARQMSNAMRLIRGEREYLAAAALLAVHCAIAFNDAVLLRLSGSVFHGQDHRQVIEITRRRCKERRLDHKGLNQLTDLLKNKSRVSYGDAIIDLIVVERLCRAAERFEAWAETMLRVDL